MRMWVLSVLLLFFFGAILPAGMAQDPAQPKSPVRTISTTGTGTVKVQPDTVRVTFGLQTMLPAVKDAREDNNKHAKKIAMALENLKIEGLKIATSNTNMQTVMSQDRNALIGGGPETPPVIHGYQVTTSFTVTVTHNDADKLREIACKIADTALENGANVGSARAAYDDELAFAIGGRFGRTGVAPRIEIFKQDIAEVRRQAMTKAVEDALANAKALAGGGKVEVLTIVADQSEPTADAQRYLPASMRSTTSTESTGQLEITVRVRVSCTY